MTRLECTQDGSSKFWEGAVEGSTLTVRFGKLGTDGQTKVKSFPDAFEAAAELAKLLKEKRAKGYVDVLAEMTSSAKTSHAAADAEFPFLFYGAKPGDRYEGIHLYEVRFATSPTATGRQAIGEAFTRAVVGSQALVDRPWLWADAWALFAVEEASIGAASKPVGYFDAVARAVEEVHAIAPIAEVVFLSARAPAKKDAWTEWTLRQRAIPSDAPARQEWAANQRLDVGCFSPRQRRIATASYVDAAFDQARAAVIAAAAPSGETSRGKSGVVGVVKCKPPARSSRALTPDQAALLAKGNLAKPYAVSGDGARMLLVRGAKGAGACATSMSPREKKKSSSTTTSP